MNNGNKDISGKSWERGGTTREMKDPHVQMIAGVWTVSSGRCRHPYLLGPQTLSLFSLFTHSFSRTWRGERERERDEQIQAEAAGEREGERTLQSRQPPESLTPYLNANLIYNLYIILCIIFLSNKIPLYNKEIWHLPGNLEFIIARTGHVTLRPTHPPSLPPLPPFIIRCSLLLRSLQGRSKVTPSPKTLCSINRVPRRDLGWHVPRDSRSVKDTSPSPTRVIS